MTQLFPIVVVAIVLVGDRFPGLDADRSPWGAVAALVAAWAPVFVVLTVVGVGLRLCDRRVARGRGPGALAAADRLLVIGRLVLLLAHAGAVFGAGWVVAIRSVTGNIILGDELLAMLPPLVGATGLWWLHYPLERRVRQALLLRRLDQGQPIYSTPSRSRYVLQQVRVQILLMLVPVVLIVGLSEAIHAAFARVGDVPAWAVSATTFGAGVSVFLAAPLLARAVLSVTSLSDGSLRDDLEAMCRRHRIRLRDFLLWRTDGTMINAAVMGLIGPLRYVLLTDSLVETMPREQIRAVMAHEIGHVRRHHMPWLIVSLFAMLLLASLLVSLAIFGLERAGVRWDAASAAWVDTGAAAASGLLALLAFGWISRRYERQADTFAVQHLSGLGAEPMPEPTPGTTPEGGAAEVAGTPAGPPGRGRLRVTREAIDAMQNALSSVARLNSVDPNRPSWRHGSIAWRQAYLASTVGLPVDAVPIDRVVRRTKVAAALVLTVAFGASIALGWWGEPAVPVEGASGSAAGGGTLVSGEDGLP